MRARWRSFELPTRIEVERETYSRTYGKFIAEPFEQGFGTTVGNGLRRVLYSSIEGAAISAVKIEGVQHEFSTLPGVYEDVTDLVLNLKQVRLILHTDGPESLRIRVKKRKGTVTGHDIEPNSNVEVVNPDIVICTLTDEGALSLDLTCKKGRGFVTAEENTEEEQELGVIPIDSIFSPVSRVRYATEYTRVGQLTNYDKLVLEIWTDGTKEPEAALVEAAKILRKHLNPFVFYFDLGSELAQEDEIEEVHIEEDPDQKRLAAPISDLELSVRASNCLEAENIQTIGDLISRSEDDLLKVRNFGKTSLKEIQKKLVELGLSLKESQPEELEPA